MFVCVVHVYGVVQIGVFVCWYLFCLVFSCVGLCVVVHGCCLCVHIVTLYCMCALCVFKSVFYVFHVYRACVLRLLDCCSELLCCAFSGVLAFGCQCLLGWSKRYRCHVLPSSCCCVFTCVVL